MNHYSQIVDVVAENLQYNLYVHVSRGTKSLDTRSFQVTFCISVTEERIEF